MYEDRKEYRQEARVTVLDTVRSNPIPVALVGIGVAWLLMNRSSSRSTGYQAHSGRLPTGDGYGYRQGPRGRAIAGTEENFLTTAKDKIGHAAHDAKDLIGNAAHDAKDKIGSVVHDVQAGIESGVGTAVEKTEALLRQARNAAGSAAHDVGEWAEGAVGTAREGYYQVKQRAVEAEHRAEDFVQENPLATGAVVFAIGAAVGLALPHTRKEDELFGKAREALLSRGQELAGETFQKLEAAAGDLMKSEPNSGERKPSSLHA